MQYQNEGGGASTRDDDAEDGGHNAAPEWEESVAQ